MTRYEQDFYAWTQEQATLLKEKRFAELDIDNLVEEVESIGKQEKRKLESRLIVLLAHLLKWYYQPEKRSRSWQATIREQRKQLAQLLAENPSLRPVLHEKYPVIYELASLRAVQETDLEPEHFPAQCPWSVEEVFEGTSGEDHL
jgi:hypothetical protein